MAIKGITYDTQGPSAAAHAEFFASTHLDGILNGCALSYLGDTLTIAAGRIVSAGRLSELQAAETITVSAASGVARVLLQTDLSQEATRTSFKQLSFVVQTADSVAALPALVQEDINSGSGVIFQSEICTLQLGSSGIEVILSRMPRSGNVALTIPLPVSGWVDGVQTVAVPAIGADSLLIVSPAPASFEEWSGCAVRATAQAAGSLTFAADSVPDADLTANVIMIGGVMG